MRVWGLSAGRKAWRNSFHLCRLLMSGRKKKSYLIPPLLHSVEGGEKSLRPTATVTQDGEGCEQIRYKLTLDLTVTQL